MAFLHISKYMDIYCSGPISNLCKDGDCNMKFQRMRSKLGKRRFAVIEDFTFCERLYLTWFRGYTYAKSTQTSRARITTYGDMQLKYTDKWEILFKPGNKTLNPLKENL